MTATHEHGLTDPGYLNFVNSCPAVFAACIKHDLREKSYGVCRSLVGSARVLHASQPHHGETGRVLHGRRSPSYVRHGDRGPFFCRLRSLRVHALRLEHCLWWVDDSYGFSGLMARQNGPLADCTLATSSNSCKSQDGRKGLVVPTSVGMLKHKILASC